MDEFAVFILGAVLVLLLVIARAKFASFQAQTGEDYSHGYPVFELDKHLRGKMTCEGTIFGPFGRMTSTFVADFDIQWDGKTGHMAETFRFNDGSTQDRLWVITLGEDGHFTAAADDVPGGGKGLQTGPAVQMLYVIKLPDASGGHMLRTVDWMYLTPDGTIVNRSQFRKFGFKVAELVATIRPADKP